MNPIIETILVPTTTAILHISPLFVGFCVALGAGVALLARVAHEETRRMAAREWAARNIRVTAADERRATL